MISSYNFIKNDVILFCVVPENQEEKTKRRLIEEALKDPDTPIEKWREFARSEYGLINGESHYIKIMFML